MRKLTTLEQENIKKWYGILTYTQISNIFKMPAQSVRSFLRRTKITRKDNKYINYSVTELIPEFFNEETVYLLGLLWADGCLHKTMNALNTISLFRKKTDVEETKSILKYWKGLSDWCETIIENPKTGFNSSGGSKFSNNDKYIAIWLRNMNFCHKSGGSPEILLKNIPEHLHYLWWRGYLDGDGWISLNGKLTKVGFVSSLEQNWEFCINICKFLDIQNYHIIKINKPKSHYSRFEISRKSDILKFLTFIYKKREEDHIGLSRKYSIFTSYNFGKIEQQSKYIGVSKTKSGKWRCYHQNKQIGVFDTEELAKEARDKAVNLKHEIEYNYNLLGM